MSMKVVVKSFRALAEALRMTPSMQAEVLVRSFRRGKESRLLLEQHKTETGQVMYILERRRATGEVKVAARERDLYDGRQRRFLSALEVKVLKNDDLPGLPSRRRRLQRRASTPAAAPAKAARGHCRHRQATRGSGAIRPEPAPATTWLAAPASKIGTANPPSR